jgi:hypothetical protein
MPDNDNRFCPENQALSKFKKVLTQRIAWISRAQITNANAAK